MPKVGKKAGHGSKGKVFAVPIAQRRKDLGVPKIQAVKLAGKQSKPYGSSKPVVVVSGPAPSIASVTMINQNDPEPSSPRPQTLFEPADPSLITRDSSAKAFMRELRKVIERSDVIIQVLDARDPEGTRSRWVEEEVRKSEGQGKKLLAVMNKIDLVPRSNLEAWLRYLRHSFPCMPFKSSTQDQRQHLSQNAVPLVQPAVVPGQAANLPSLPVTSSSLGAPALLHLLKQYALSTPHSSLTVGVVGYPNVGKSSLINSLKRSRACAVAAMPGKTRIVQEVVLDKGVKIIDCPGVVLEDFGRRLEGEEPRRRQAEIMLRNCIKAELVEDPIAPVQVMLSKLQPAVLEKVYSIPPFDDVGDFLIKVALTRGRLGKGSAVSVLRDWNSGKIPFFTIPPTIHPSAAPAPPALRDDMDMSQDVGDARILNTLSEAFTLDGLFDHAGDAAAWEGEEAADQTPMVEDEALLEETVPSGFVPDPLSPISESVFPRRSLPTPAVSLQRSQAPLIFARHLPNTSAAKLFTPEELAVLPTDVLSRQKYKQQAKKAKKRRMATEKTQDELMLGSMGIGMDEPEPELEESGLRVTTKKMKKAMKKIVKPTAMEVDEEVQKEADFANFLATMGADDEDEEL